MAVLEVDQLTVRFGATTAVDAITFAARAGEVTALLGANGAGKTTTVETCEGYRAATSGSVRVLGLDPAREQRKLSERMGVMLQDGGLTPSSKVLPTISHYCALYRRGVDAPSLVRAVGLEGKERSTWRRLSGGERQRLSLALALAARPDVAFLDEPTSGVDLHGREAIRGLIGGLRADGAAVILTTHELDEAERLADRIVILHRGRVVGNGTLEELQAGGDEIRFRSAPDLDLASLAATLGMYASKVGRDEYVVDAPAHPRIIAQLSGWLADHGAELRDLRAGALPLEEVVRRLTRDRGGEEQR